MKTIRITEQDAKQKRCTPAAIGNGDLSLLIDYEGMQRQTEAGWGKLIPGIRRAGFRYNTPLGELIPFGYFLTEIPGTGSVENFQQTLDPSCGLVTSDCLYADGTELHAETFCALHRNIVVLKRRIDRLAGRPFRLLHHFSPKYAELEWNPDGEIRYAPTNFGWPT